MAECSVLLDRWYCKGFANRRPPPAGSLVRKSIASSGRARGGWRDSLALSSGDAPIRVAYLVEQILPGGAERQLFNLLQSVDQSRFDLSIVAGAGSGFMLDEYQRLGIPITFVKSARGGGKLATMGAVNAVRRGRPHVLHGFQFTANAWGAAARLTFGSIVFIAGARGMQPDLTLSQRLARDAIRRCADHVVTNSVAQTAELYDAGIPSRRVSVIPNGVDISRFPYPGDRQAARSALHLPANGPVIGMVASFYPVKRWDVFLSAAARVARQRPDVNIVCIGEGSLRPAIEESARRLGISGQTRFTGARRDVPALLPGLDVLALSSDTEGLPNSVLEAMASGLPIVATDVGGVAEAVDEGRTGLLTPRADSAAMADGILSLLDKPRRAEEMGAAGRARVEADFSMDTATKATMDLYERLLTQSSPGRERIKAVGRALRLPTLGR